MLNKTCRVRKNVDVQFAFFPDGPWFSAEYIDRRKETCCKVQSIEVTLFKFMFGIEWYDRQA